MIEYRAALYSSEGDLIRTSAAFPVETTPQPQQTADLMALAAASGSAVRVVGQPAGIS